MPWWNPYNLFKPPPEKPPGEILKEYGNNTRPFDDKTKSEIKTRILRYYQYQFDSGLAYKCPYCGEMMTDMDDVLIGILTDEDGYRITVGAQHKFCEGIPDESIDL